jgi:hypothetical protein
VISRERARGTMDKRALIGIAFEKRDQKREAANRTAYYASHGDERRAYQIPYQAAYRITHRGYSNMYNARLKMDVLNAYGGPVCACCGETLLEGLTIDHVNGDGAKHRRELGTSLGGSRFYSWLKKHGYPAGFQVLCFTCNVAKGTGDHCPHRDVWACSPP